MKRFLAATAALIIAIPLGFVAHKAVATLDPTVWTAEANTTVMPALSFSLDFFQPHRITPELALGSQDVDENGDAIAPLDYLAEAQNRSGKPLWFTR